MAAITIELPPALPHTTLKKLKAGTFFRFVDHTTLPDVYATTWFDPDRKDMFSGKRLAYSFFSITNPESSWAGDRDSSLCGEAVEPLPKGTILRVTV